jgi:hypothetical protein
MRKIEGHKKKRRQCDAERMRKSKKEKKKECTEVVEIVSGTLVCYTLKSAPKTDKGLVASRVPGGGVRLACYVFVFFPFFVLFSMSVIQRFLFFDLSTGAGARK